jgi:hypothetical protein
MRSDLSEHYCCVQKGMKNHIRVIWTHKLFVRYLPRKWVCIHGYQWVKVPLLLILFRSRTFAHVLSLTHFLSRIIEIRFYEIVIYLTSSCVIWAFFGMSGLV